MTALEDGAQHEVAGQLDDAIRAVVVRLSRPHASGGDVIERAAILAEGGDAEATVPRAPSRGLHGARLAGDPGATRDIPRRYVLPVGALA
jgi:hypothetical protein